MATTISAPQSAGLLLTTASQDPVMITGAGSIITAAGYAIYGTASYAWTITNSGAVAVGSAATSHGIVLLGGGTVVNAPVTSGSINAGGAAVYLRVNGSAGLVENGGGGEISGGVAGVAMKGTAAGTVTNAGTISGPVGVYFSGGPGTVTNAGSIFAGSGGVTLAAGGSVDNAAAISGGFAGVYIGGASGIVTNEATITGTNLVGVALIAGGVVINGTSGDTTAAITGGIVGVGLTGSTAATLVNGGTIIATGPTSTGVGLTSGGAVVNGAYGATAAVMSGVLYGVGFLGSAPELITNLATITATGSAGAGIGLDGGGVVINGVATATAALAFGAAAGITVTNGSGTIVNYGTVLGSLGVGFGAGAGAAIVLNGGTITGTGGTAVAFASGDDVVAMKPGAVFGGVVVASTTGSNRLDLATGAGIGTIGSIGSASFANFGTIAVDAGAQWSLPASNDFAAGVTLTNAGTITGSVTLAGGDNVLVVKPGAVFGGAVIASGTGANTLELGSAASVGTFDGIGSAGFVNFPNFAVVAGAQWSLAGDNTVAAGATLTNGGTLLVAGTLTNVGGIGGDVTLAGGTVVNTTGATIAGTVRGVGGPGLLTNRGLIGGGDTAVNLTAAGVVENFGTLRGGTLNSSLGVGLHAGGTVSNGSATDTTAFIGAGDLGVLMYGTGVLTNFGTILDGSSIVGEGVMLDSGSLGNGSTADTTASIAAGGNAVQFSGIATIANYGTIRSTNANGVFLSAGGTVVNGSAGDGAAAIYGGIQAELAGTPVTLANYGAISAKFFGLLLQSGGTVTNHAGGHIAGDTGVQLDAGTRTNTVENAGTITGSGGTSVNFIGGDARLIVDPGAVFAGAVIAGATGANTIELAAAATAGTIDGLGSSFSNFGTIEVDAGADWLATGVTGAAAFTLQGAALTLPGSLDPATSFDLRHGGGPDTLSLTGMAGATSFADAIGGVSTGDRIVLEGESFAPGDTASATAGDLVVRDSLANPVFTFSDFTVAAGQPVEFSVGGDFVQAVPCFVAGTRIATPSGEVAVEHLRQGDRVLLARGGSAPVAWLGHRRLDCRRHQRPHDILPVSIRAGAFGRGLPRRDLLLSPDHAVHLDGDGEDAAPGVLIPVRYLVNGRTIAQQRVAEVTYFHVELPTHEVILAEGLSVESYLDTGNRGAFANGGDALQLHPDFARQVWDRRGCARLVTEGTTLIAARRNLLMSARALGFAITRDPGLRVLANGFVLAAEADHGRWRVELPQPARHLRLLSRRWVPAHTSAAESDARTLGVAVAGLRADGIPIALDDPRLSSGWCAPEPGWRWTDGDAGLALAGVRRLEFTVAMTGRYWRRQAFRGAVAPEVSPATARG